MAEKGNNKTAEVQPNGVGGGLPDLASAIETARTQDTPVSSSVNAPASTNTTGLQATVTADSAQDGASAPASKLAAEPATPNNYRVRNWIIRGSVVAAVVGLFGLGYLFMNRGHHQANASQQGSVSSDYAATTAPLHDLAKEGAPSLGVVSDTSAQLTVNGVLNANGGLVISASGVPTHPVKGQLYFSRTDNKLYFFNGTSFIDVTYASTAANNSVASVQGQTGAVTFNGGTGIDVKGTTITNTGVTSLLSGSANLVITSDGNGGYTVSDSAAPAAQVSLQNTSPGSPQTGNINITGTVIAGSFNGDGSALTGLNASSISSGTLSNARLSANVTVQGNSFNGANQLVQLDGSGNLPALSGVNLTALNGSAISSGTVADARLSTNVTLQGNTFNGGNQLVKLNSSGDLPALSAINLTNLNVSNATAGTLADNRLSTNVTLQGNSFNNANQLVQLTNLGYLPALNGSNVTTLNGTAITSGTVNDARLSGNVAFLNAGNTFTGSNTFTQAINANTITPSAALTVGAAGQTFTLQGDGASLIVGNRNGHTVSIGFSGTQLTDVQYTFDTTGVAAGTYQICTKAGNCDGSGSGVTTTGGVINRIPRYTSGTVLGNSSISDDGVTVTVQNASNSTNAFQIQNLAGNSNLFVADTTHTRIGIGTATPGYTLDVNGNINSSTALYVAGTKVCDNTGCLAGLGSGFYVQNGTVLQNNTNFNIGSASASSVGGVINGASGQTADLFELQQGATTVAKFTPTGNVDITGAYKINGNQIASTDLGDSSNVARLNGNQTFTGNNTFTGVIIQQTSALPAFQIQNSTATSNLFIADTLDTRIGIGTATPGYTLDVNGDVNISNGSLYRINGVAICGQLTATCAPSAGSNNYIQNSTSQQGSANFNIQSTNGTAVGGIIRGNSGGQTADLLRLQDASGANVASFGNEGLLTLGQNGAATGAVAFNANGGTGSVTLTTTNPGSSSYTATLPANSGTVALLSVTAGSQQSGNLSTSGTVTAGSFIGDGSTLTNLSGTNIATGTVADARLTTNVTLAGNTFNGSSQLVQTTAGGALPVISGANLTSLNGTNISSGTVADARLTGNVTLAGNTFNGASQLVQLNGSGLLPALSGANLINLNGTNISSGTVDASHLPASITYMNNTFNGVSQLVQLDGSGFLPGLNGSALTNLSATALTGTINDARLSNNVALLSGTQTFTGSKTFSSAINANTITPSSALVVGATGQSFTLQGNGSSLITSTKSGQTTTIAFSGTPTGAVNYNFDMSAAAGTYDICTKAGNCVGSGGGVTTTGGTTGKLAVYTGSQVIGNSQISDNGTKVSVQNSTGESTNAFEIQNHTGTSNLFIADTQNTRIGIGTATPGYTLDVNGTINATTGIYIGGNPICDSTGCATSSTSAGSFIKNQTGQQTAANFNIQSNSGSSVVGVLRGKSTGQTADLLDLQDANANVVAGFANNGVLTLGSGSGGAGVTGSISFKGSGNSNAITLKGQDNPSAGPLTLTLPNESGTLCSTGSVCSGYQASGNYANNTLSNLSASNAINTSLLAGSSSIDLGSSASPFRSLYLGGTATNNFNFTGTASAARTLTLSDNSGTVALLSPTSQQSGNLNIAGTIASGAITGTSTIQGTSINGTTGINTGGAGGTQRIDASGNLVNIGTISTSGNINSQTIGSAANFTGTLAVKGANALTLGTASTNTGAILFNGSGSANAITLKGPDSPGSGLTLTLPNETGTLCSNTTVCSNYSAAANNGNYIINGTSAQASSNFNISGTGIAGTALQAPAIDTVSGALTIGATNATNITVGRTSGTGNLTLQTNTGNLSLQTQGTGTLGIGNNSVAQTIVIGNTTGATSLSELVGTGNYSLDGVGGSTYSIGASTTTGTITIGGTAQTGAINLGTGTGVQSINLGTGGTGAKTVTLGSTASTSTTTLQAGTSGVIVQTAASSSAFQVNASAFNENPMTVNTNTSAGSDNTISPGNKGYSFTPNVNGSITQLGLRNSATGAPYLVSLYLASGGSPLATASITSTGVGTWVYSSITPVAVTAGTQYVVTAYIPNAQHYNITGMANSLPYTTHNITINQVLVDSNTGAADLPNTVNNSGSVFGTPDVTFVATTSNNNMFNINNSTNTSTLGDQFNASTTTVGSPYGSSTTNIQGGSGGINIGTNSISNGILTTPTITLGASNGFSSQTINVGTSNISTITIGNATTGNSTAVYGGTGGLTLGSSTAGATSVQGTSLNVATGGGTVQIGASNTASLTQTINIGNNSNATSNVTTVAVGTLQGSGSTTIQAGSGGGTFAVQGTLALKSNTSTNGASGAVNLSTGAASGGVSNTSGSINITTGNASGGLGTLSGSITLDVGTATGGTGNTVGSINIGTVNPTNLTLGNATSSATTLQGSLIQVNTVGALNLSKTNIYTDNSSYSNFAIGSISTSNTGGTFSGSGSATYYYKVVPISGGGNDVPSGEVSVAGGSSFTPVNAPTAAPTQTNAAGGLIGGGIYKYIITYKTANGETTQASAALTTPTLGASRKVTLTLSPVNVGTGSPITSINIYRTKAGGSTYYLLDSGLSSVTSQTCYTGNAALTFSGSGTLTSCIDNANDTALAAVVNPPITNTATTNTNSITVNWTAGAGALQYQLWRGTSSNGENTCYSGISGSTTSYLDTNAAGSTCVIAGSIVSAVPTNTAPTYGRIGIGTSAPTGDITFGGNTNKTINVLAGTTGGLNLTLQAGAAGSGNNDGGKLIFQGGAGSGTGKAGGVVVQPVNDSTAGGAFQIQSAGGVVLWSYDTSTKKIQTSQPDGASVIGFAFNTTVAYSTAGAKLLSVQNNGTEKFAIDWNGHILTGGNAISTPVAAAGAGSTASCSLTGNDTAGTVTITSSGSGQAAGLACTVTFASAYSSTPRPVLTATNANGAAIQAYVGASSGSPSTMTISFGVAPTNGQSYTFNYHVFQ